MILQFLIYLLEASICVAGFWGLYRLILHKRTHFNWNRAYLLLCIPISLGIPLLNISIDKNPALSPITFLSESWEEVTAAQTSEVIPIVQESHQWELPAWSTQLFIVYLLGVFWAGIKLIRSIKDILQRVHFSTGEKHIGYYILYAKDQHIAFSFFNYIFLGERFHELSSKEKQSILEHEKIHAKQLHSLDVLFFEIIGILFWFHPLVKLMKDDIANTHEFIADQIVAKKQGVHDYSRLVVQLASSTNQFQLANHFAYLPIKKRVKMLLNSKKQNKFVFLSAIPMLFVGLALFSFNNKTLTQEKLSIEITPQKSLISWVTPKDKLKPSIRPVDAPINSPFGMRTHPVLKHRKLHMGCDFILPIGIPVVATADGKIIFVKTSKGGYGTHIKVQHASSKYVTLYAHLSKVEVKEGEKVNQGDVIGYVGNSGLSQKPHLHYEVIENGKRVNPAIFFPSMKGDKTHTDSTD